MAERFSMWTRPYSFMKSSAIIYYFTCRLNLSQIHGSAQCHNIILDFRLGACKCLCRTCFMEMHTKDLAKVKTSRCFGDANFAGGKGLKSYSHLFGEADDVICIQHNQDQASD